mgnify:CR=1 FL=1
MAAEQKMQDVFTASLRCFARFGYKKATMEEIAGELGLTKGALYSYADNKEDLYQKTIADALTRWQDRVKDEVDKKNDPRDKFEVMSFKAFQYLAEDNDLRQVLVNDPNIFPMFPKEDRFYEINENSRKLLSSIIEEGIESGLFRQVDLESVSWLLFSIYKMFIIDTYIVSEKEATEKLFKDAVDLITHGLLK